MYSRRMRFLKEATDTVKAPPGVEQHPVPPMKAVALGYDPHKDAAPAVLASGKGSVAERIIALGKEHHIPVIEDKALAEALAQVDVGAWIPPELYTIVAEVLVYVYRIKGKRPK